MGKQCAALPFGWLIALIQMVWIIVRLPVAGRITPGRDRARRPDLEPKDAQRILRHYDAPSAIITTSDGELLGIIRIAQKKSQKTHKAA